MAYVEKKKLTLSQSLTCNLKSVFAGLSSRRRESGSSSAEDANMVQKLNEMHGKVFIHDFALDYLHYFSSSFILSFYILFSF